MQGLGLLFQTILLCISADRLAMKSYPSCRHFSALCALVFVWSLILSAHAAAGARDLSFATPTTTDQPPSAMRVQSDNKIIVAGNFQNYAGAGKKTIARLTADGAIDSTFDSVGGATYSTSPGSITEFEILPDGRIVATGTFDKFNGVARNSIVLLNSNGSLDSTFNPTIVGSIKDLAVQTDGKILICGPNSVNGVTKTWKVFRVNADGSTDPTFVGPTLGNSVSPLQIKALANGKILVCGTYLADGTSATVFPVIRLNSDGALDNTFVLGKGGEGSPSGVVTRMEVAPDNKIIIAGLFTNYNSVAAAHMARLNEDGSVDSSFNLTGATFASITDLAIQPDNKILFLGSYSGALQGKNLIRIEASGNYDSAYLPEIGKDGATTASRVIMQGTQPLLSATVIQFVPSFAFIYGVFRLTGDTAGPPSITTPPAAQTVTETGSAQFKVTAGGTGPFTYQWKKGTSAIANATNDTYTISVVSTNDAGSYSVDVTNASGTTPSAAALLTVLPMTPGKVFRDSLAVPGANSNVKYISRAPEGKILVSGEFSSFAGTNRNRVARLLQNGQLDGAFNPPTSVSLTIGYIVAAQSDGKVILGGNVFATYNNVDHFGLLRFLTTGALDTTFNASSNGTDDTPFAIAIQTDDKILTGGFANAYNGATLGHLYRVTAAGSPDTGFNSNGAGLGPLLGYLKDLAIRADGKILGAGLIASYNGVARNGAVLLNTDGSLDSTFVPALPANTVINAIAVQADNKVLVGGAFQIGLPPVSVGILRLNTNGSIDNTFTSPVFNDSLGQIFDIALQQDGKIVIGGTFNNGIGGTAFKNIARLKSTGAVDTAFDPGSGPDGAVMTVCVTPENTLWIGGEFNTVDGLPRPHIARLNIGALEATGTPVAFNYTGGRLTLDWPSALFSLQFTTNLVPASWSTLLDVPPFTATNRGFYRLIAK